MKQNIVKIALWAALGLALLSGVFACEKTPPETPAMIASPEVKPDTTASALDPADDPSEPAPPEPRPQEDSSRVEELVLGQSVRGREIRAYYFNRSERVPALVFSSIHGDEKPAKILGEKLTERWLQDPSVLKGAFVIFIPCANPDGLALNTRQNANQVDANRNFPAGWRPGKKGSMTYSGPAPLSEPEAKLLYDLVEKERPAVIISIHSCRRCGGMNNFDGPANAYAALMSAKNGYRASPEWQAETPGSFGTWAGKGKKIPTLTLEMPNNIEPGDYQKNIAAVEAVIEFQFFLE